MPGKYYMLINPFIDGSITTVFKAANSLAAADKAYKTLSNYFSNKLHNFKFSLLKIKSSEIKHSPHKILNLLSYTKNKKRINPENFYHFIVNEKHTKNNSVKYIIKRFTDTTDNIDKLINNIINIQNKHKKQSGGKQSIYSDDIDELKHTMFDDDDSDSDDPDYYIVQTSIRPIRNFYYTPFLYNGPRIFIPNIPLDCNFIILQNIIP